MASNFNREDPFAIVPPEEDGAIEEPNVPESPRESVAQQRFSTCRWQQPAEGQEAAYCLHQEVKPYAGTTGFDPEAWCGDCEHFKLRRTPKKRPRSDDPYDSY